jgi:cytochrome c553
MKPAYCTILGLRESGNFQVRSMIQALNLARLSVRAGAFMGAALLCGSVLAQAATAKPDLNKGQQIAAAACAACHGADGNATSPANPKLSAQHPDYLYKQLTNFVAKPGAKEPERNNAIMAGFAATLSDDDRRNVSAWFASQSLKPASARNKDLVELGQRIYRGGIPEKNVPSCAGCHGPAGAGIPAQYPRLGGQWADYTESQLTQFRAGQRKNSAQMTAISARLSDGEIKAISDYIAGLR